MRVASYVSLTFYPLLPASLFSHVSAQRMARTLFREIAFRSVTDQNQHGSVLRDSARVETKLNPLSGNVQAALSHYARTHTQTII